MSLFRLLLTDNITRGLGWTLLHSLWQILALAALTALLLTRLERATATVRYGIACVAMAAMFLVVPCTLTHELAQATSHAAPSPVITSVNFTIANSWSDFPEAMAESGHAGRSESGLQDWYGRRVDQLDRAAPYLAFVWLMGFMLISLRIGAGCQSASRLTKSAVEKLPDRIDLTVHRLARRIGITRPFRSLASAQVDVPCIVGWLRPVLLVPISILSEISPSQLEALLAHELAHIRRYDYLVNMLQRLMESVLFYHPAVWWLTRRIREERENCCDDIAVASCGDVREVAIALVRLEESRAGIPSMALAASGGNLLARVRRLVAPGVVPQSSPAPATLTAVVIVGLVIAVGAQWSDAVRPSDDKRDARAGLILYADSEGKPSTRPVSPAQRAVAERLKKRIVLGEQNVQLREVAARLSRATSLRVVFPLELGMCEVRGRFGSRPLSDELASMLSAVELGCCVETNGNLRIDTIAQLAAPLPGMLQFGARLDAESLRRKLFEGDASSVSELIETLDERIPAVITQADRDALVGILRRIEEMLPSEMALGSLTIQAERMSTVDNAVQFSVELGGMCRVPGASAAKRVEVIEGFKWRLEKTPAIIDTFESSAQISTHDGAELVNPLPNITAFSLVLASRTR